MLAGSPPPRKKTGAPFHNHNRNRKSIDGCNCRTPSIIEAQMSAFLDALKAAQPRRHAGRRWLYVPYDQLSDQIGPLAHEPADELGIVLLENPRKAARRPYHKQKLALVLANGRHFAVEQAARGVAVRFVVASDSYAVTLTTLAAELGPLRVMRPAERELRHELAPLFASGALVEIPHEGWLTTRQQFSAACPRPPFRMDRFYRRVRQDSGLLMAGAQFAGGKVSHDEDNRQPWRGAPPAPTPPRFARNAITDEVVALVERAYADHPGQLDAQQLPSTRADAEALWRWALDECLESFGPFEDAMSTRSRSLFHTRISGLLNLHRLLPPRLVADVAALDIPLSSQEGFIRQLLGWREYVRHVHEATDGFRTLDSNSAPSELGASAPLPPAYWGTASGLHCLDSVVRDVWSEGYSHHITRLMVLGNIATLLDLSPRELTDWFWVAYVDAYDWVVEPNVLAMGTWGAGDLMVTKPYVAGAAYIERMSDYCGGCRFSPKKSSRKPACPITPLYWAFLNRHREKLAGNYRLKLPLAAAAQRSPAQKQSDAETFNQVRETLAAGKELVG